VARGGGGALEAGVVLPRDFCNYDNDGEEEKEGMPSPNTLVAFGSKSTFANSLL